MALNNEQETIIANNEVSLLGLLLRNPDTYIEIAEIIKPEMFHFKQNQILYQAIGEIHNNYVKFDIANLLDYIEKSKLSSNITFFGKKAVEYIEFLVQNGGYKEDLDKYAKKIIDQYKLEKILNLLSRTEQIIKNQTFDVGDLISKLQLELINIDVSEINSSYTKLSEEVEKIVLNLNDDDKNDVSIGLEFGYKQLDDLLLGANPGDLIILAARPSVGKTAFALNIANRVAKQKKTVLFFSLEMSNSQLVQRMIAIDSMIHISKLRAKALTKEDWKEIYWTKQEMNKWNLFLNDKPTLTIADINTLAKRFARNTPVDLVIVDYLQLIGDSSKSGSENRQLEVSKISRSLKQLARELKCPVLSLSQLSRNVEKREDKTPILSDLRESGTIEQDADIVIFLHRKDYYQKKKMRNESQSEEDTSADLTTNYSASGSEYSNTNVIVAKNRHGATGVVQLAFGPANNRFYYLDDKNAKQKEKKDE